MIERISYQYCLMFCWICRMSWGKNLWYRIFATWHVPNSMKKWYFNCKPLYLYLFICYYTHCEKTTMVGKIDTVGQISKNPKTKWKDDSFETKSFDCSVWNKTNHVAIPQVKILTPNTPSKKKPQRHNTNNVAVWDYPVLRSNQLTMSKVEWTVMKKQSKLK